MGYTWAAALACVLSAVLTYFLSFETLSTPVAIKLSQCAVTNTHVTGFVYKTVMLVRISQKGRERSQSGIYSLGHRLWSYTVQPWHMHQACSLFQTDLPLHQEFFWVAVFCCYIGSHLHGA